MRKLFALLLVVFLFGGSAMAFAFWDQLETTSEEVEIGIGEGVVISVSLDDYAEGNLIPEDAVLKDGDVKEVELEFTVTLSSIDLDEILDLEVSVINLAINGDTNLAHVVDVPVPTGLTIENDPVEVKLTVKLNMPADEAEYDLVKNQNITFDVEFNATRQ